MRRSLTVALVALMSLATASTASYQTFQLTDAAMDSEFSRVAASPQGAVLVAWERSGAIWSQLFAAGSLADPTLHGSGQQPDVAWNGGQFHLAWAHENGVDHLASVDGQDWASASPYFNGSDFRHVRLTGHQSGVDFEDILLSCIQGENLVHMNGYAFFVPASYGIMGAVAVPAREFTLSYDRLYVSYGDSGSQLGYFDVFGNLTHVSQPDAYAGDLVAAAMGPDGTQHLLSLSEPALCYCANLGYRSCAESFEYPPEIEWSDPLSMVVPLDYYHWPMSPAIAADASNRVHAFWYQESRDAMFDNFVANNFYFVLEAGSWTDESALLGGGVGSHTDLDLGAGDAPVFVWAEEIEGVMQVMLRLDPGATSTEAPAVAGLRQSVHPNPFNPQTTIRIELPADTALRLAITDVAGRVLRVLASGPRPAGAAVIAWDGRDDAGRALPSGVYLAHTSSGQGSVTSKLVLLR